MISNLGNAIQDVIRNLMNPSRAQFPHTAADASVNNLTKSCTVCVWYENLKQSIPVEMFEIIALSSLIEIYSMSGGSVCITDCLPTRSKYPSALKFNVGIVNSRKFCSTFDFSYYLFTF